ncbi:hypothetical protein HanRHA438_Chr15g0715551 [Helianthus annuus]|uniref:Uncharacterized protein n=1 Tax=Helianthus annuus TaxID=4232 RepID=A0A251TJS4_HELAN|nr:uncharacterized protein LOC110885137 [Helianthus annuus]KAF5765381.1 hypothetical protein HanXRQr2_Chr15g0703181 [Helianthus annuus]KAJ0451919.1 hypothetical protein HanHA300_Chr15g0573101 [Helianthus annuus]KAJ0456643.1 hypothetical protein HanIR_Chr15g0764821 [Helianthus annuus]KAJ0473804.1 hypothetical protein HanHA89_Chr15g0622581 [Helianthus annuus]KAJ0649379.1 hypothetical protein HanLR1_Chr15g0583661 [Helianthus annuus]
MTPFLLECNYNSNHSLLQSSYLRSLRSLLGLLFLYDHHRGRVAMAASGGSMGGSDFSSSDHSYGDHSYSYDDYSYACSDPTYYSSGRYSHRTSSRAPMKATNEVEPIRLQDVITVIAVVFFVLLIFIYTPGQDRAQTSVVKLQVGSLATGRSLQRDLNRIAEVVDTSTKKGWHFVLQESILSLLRHSHDCISGYSSVDVKRSTVECEKRFNQLSVEERGKFDEETLVNINNNVRKKSATTSSNGLPNEYIVVTIIVAARGVPELPPVESSAQLKEALQKLASIPSSNIMAVQVLWTPQKEDDSLTEQKMLKDYPLLRPL